MLAALDTGIAKKKKENKKKQILELVLLILNICFHHREKRKQNRLLDRGIHYSAIELKFCATIQPTRKKATAEVRLI